MIASAVPWMEADDAQLESAEAGQRPLRSSHRLSDLNDHLDKLVIFPIDVAAGVVQLDDPKLGVRASEQGRKVIERPRKDLERREERERIVDHQKGPTSGTELM